MTLFSVIKNGLVPADDDARAMLSKLKIGAIVDVDVLNPINTKFNSLIFATLGKLAKATGVTLKSMKARMLVLTGRYEMVQVTPHKKVMVANSMSRSSMTQADREDFWNDMREIATEQILPFVDEHAADEIRSMMADQYGQPNQTESVGTGNQNAP